jgi:hypothetical protein
MASRNLTLLRTVPANQAIAYNSYIQKSALVRQDVYSTGESKLAQISKLVAAAQSTLADLLTGSNDAEKAIRKAAAPAAGQAGEASLTKIRWAFDNNIDIAVICDQLVEDVDVDGFLALSQVLPWAAKANKLSGAHSRPEDNLKAARATILGYEKQLMTPAQLALQDELRELDVSMGMLRSNFLVLNSFFEMQTLPSAVQGSFQRVSKLYRWQGLPGDNQPKGSINLADDLSGAIGDDVTTPYNPSNKPYLQDGRGQVMATQKAAQH